MDVNGHNVHARRSMGALPPITVQELGYDPVRMRSRSSPIGNDTGDTRPFFRSLRNTGGCDAGQSHRTGSFQYFPPGKFRPHIVIFSHERLLGVAAWALVEG